MIAYKFLNRDRVAPFTGFLWPAPGDGWVELAGEPSLCSRGIHACRVSDLPYWLTEELWRMELGGAVVEHELKLVAQRGRLLGRVDAWAGAARMRFAEFCLDRVVHHAAGELRAAGLEAEARAIQRAARSREGGETGPLRAAADAAATSAAAGERMVRHAGHLAGYVVDAVDWLSDPAGVAYVAAHAADARVDPDDDGDPFARERAHQARWIADELDLNVS